VIQKFHERIHYCFYIGEIHQDAGIRIGLTFDSDGYFEAVTMHPAAFVPVGKGGNVMSGLKPEFSRQYDRHQKLFQQMNERDVNISNGAKGKAVCYFCFMLFRILIFLFTAIFVSCKPLNRDLIDNAPLISISFTDDLGRTVKLPDVPRKVISLSPNTTEIICAIGAENLLVARSELCFFPLSIAKLPAIPIVPDPDLPAVVLYEADLVIASNETMDSAWVYALSRLRVPVFYQSYQSTDDIYRNILSLGRILGKNEQAKILADSLKGIEKRITEATANEIKYGTMVLLQVSPPAVAGKNSFINDLIGKAGGKNVFGDKAGLKYPTVTAEEILARNPEVIIFPTKNENEYGAFIAGYPDLIQLSANRQNRVFVLDPGILIRPGPRSMEGLAMLTRCLHSRIDVNKLAGWK